MSHRRFRLAFALLALAVVVAGAAIAAFVLRPNATAGAQRAEVEGELPPALAAHLQELSEAIPGNGGESREGPGGPAGENFFERAYPANDINVAKLNAAAVAADKAKKRFPIGKGHKGSWVSIGPSNAVYPFFEFRDINLYVPNEYAAAGRTTSMAISPSCTMGHCRVWIAAAGGGVWRTDQALHNNPKWTYLSTPFEINSTGSIKLDPNDPSGNTIWVGTGEPNACGSGCVAGVGLYKSVNGGNTWTGPIGKQYFNARGIGSIAIEPGNSNVMYVATGRALLGASSVCCGGAVTLIPGAPIWGLYKSTDGGGTFNLIHNGAATVAGCTDPAQVAGNATPCSPRGVRDVELDPSDPEIVYAGSYARGVWRSPDAGATWVQIQPPIAPGPATGFTERPELSANSLPNGNTRLYVGIGSVGPSEALPTNHSRLLRTDDAAGAAAFTDLTDTTPAGDGFGSFNYCTGQCWYDNTVYSPPGHPDIVYLGGAHQYRGGSIFNEAGRLSNGRGVVLSTDAGETFTDVTADSTDTQHPNGIHPDHHAIVTHPNNPFLFIEAGDGGIVRSSGQLTDISGNCASRGLNAADLARCEQLLSSVPTRIDSINRGLSTLQFQSLSVNPFDVEDVQGGTQDNGTWENYGNRITWTNTMIGDGGQSGFDAANPQFRFHTFFERQVDVNFSNGAVADWNWISDVLFVAGENAAFYVPIISDPTVSGTMFIGMSHVWRTKTHGRGSMTLEQLRANCNEWTGAFDPDVPCGDWVRLQAPGAAGALNCLTSTTPACPYGNDKVPAANNWVAATERAPGDDSTMWAATSGGRVFVSENADAEPASSVVFNRIDTAAQPNRFVSGIYVDPNNANRAWVSFSGFNASTPATPGHVFRVLYNPETNTATWTDVSHDLADLPITDVAFDDVTGDLYASSDFGVVRLASGTTSWTRAFDGLPNVEVAGLTIVPGERKLFAATHGLSAWSLTLP